jgi:ABC-type branched-subunit amino acid transport system ATPase component
MLAIGRGVMAAKLLLLGQPSLGFRRSCVKRADIVERIARRHRSSSSSRMQAARRSPRRATCWARRDRSEGSGEELQGNDYVRQAYLGL